MYLSPADIRQTRLDTLEQLHGVSRAWVEATEKLSGLALRAGRQCIAEGGKHLETFAQGGQLAVGSQPMECFGAWREEAAKLTREYFEIIGEANQSMLLIARAQMSVLDKALQKRLDHAAQSADAVGGEAIVQVKKAILKAEAGFNKLADVAAHSTEQLEEKIREVSAALAVPVEAEIVSAPVVSASVVEAPVVKAPAKPRAPRKPRAPKATAE